MVIQVQIWRGSPGGNPYEYEMTVERTLFTTDSWHAPFVGRMQRISINFVRFGNVRYPVRHNTETGVWTCNVHHDDPVGKKAK